MAEYWLPTIDLLQGAEPLIEKPRLKPELLQKPPFRFLHDVISAVQQRTGFAPGLYEGVELDAKALQQDKDAKIAYLTKIINVVSLALNQGVPARPAKIVAGMEPESTNIFLQMLAKAAAMGSGAQAVQQVLASAQPADGAAAPEAPRPSSRPSSQQEPRPAAPPEAAPAPPPAEQQPAKHRRDRPPLPEAPPQTSRPEAGPRTSTAAAAAVAEDTEPAPSSRTSSSRGKERQSSGQAQRPAAEEVAPPPQTRHSSSRPSEDNGRGSSSRDKRQDSSRSSRQAPPQPPPPPPAPEPPAPAPQPALHEPPALFDEMQRPSTTGGQKFQRPVSAKKAPPKVAQPDQNKTAVKPPLPGSRPGSKQSERLGAGPAPAIAVFHDSHREEEEDDVEVVTETEPQGARSHVGADGKGVLVKSIMEAEKNLKQAQEADTTAEEDGSTGIILRKLGRAAQAAGPKPGDLTAVRDLVQNLCSNTQPLAKCVDYLQEDLETMTKEYRFWATERRVYQDKLAEEQRLGQDNSHSQAQMTEVEAQIKHAKERILSAKAQILRNDDTIQKLLSMVVAGTR